MEARAITIEADGYIMRFTPLEDDWHWRLSVTIPANPGESGSGPRTITPDLKRAGGEDYTTAEVLYQVSLTAHNIEPGVT